ncbi:metallophosphoesterase [Streptosporangiaceae bacterium NEAU-GS5]|nr:metallophosphoesterase [Streptosporangiaceae bacterium NEAU-GS5]
MTRLHRVIAAAALIALATGCSPSTAQPSPVTPISSNAPRPVAAESGFIVLGDFGAGTPEQTQVAKQMRVWAGRHRVDAIVTTGDNVYPDGSPDLYDRVLRKPYERLGVPMWATLGNHDVVGGHAAEELAFLKLLRPPTAKIIPGAQLLFMDANDVSPAQTRWLDDTLSAPGPALRIVVFHQPAWSCSYHGSTPAVDKMWVPIFERHRVALVLNGHDHNYQRYVSGKGVSYVVTGGGGAGLYPLKSGCAGQPKRAAAFKRHHFVGVEIAGGKLTLTAVDASGRVFDQVVLSR